MIGGLAGAFTLSVLNETAKRIDTRANHLDLLGMNAIAKVIKGHGLKKFLLGQTNQASLGGDLMTSSMYYGLARGADAKQTIVRGSLLGLSAGMGAVALSKPLGLDERAANVPVQTKALTIACYLIGGLVAAGVMTLLDHDHQHP